MHWYKIVDKDKKGNFKALFHSDILLTEKNYSTQIFKNLNRDNALYAINIKGVTPEDYYKNTGHKFDDRLFWSNLHTIIESGINFYLTFTNPDKDNLEKFKDSLCIDFGDWILDDSFIINLVEYEALKEEKI